MLEEVIDLQKKPDEAATPAAAQGAAPAYSLKAKELGIDTLHEAILFVHRESVVCRAEGLSALARVVVSYEGKTIVATLDVVHSDLLRRDEASLSLAAWQFLRLRNGSRITVSHLRPLESMGQVRAKIYGQELSRESLKNIVSDISRDAYSDVELSSFLTACAANTLSEREIIDLTDAMIEAGERLHWGSPVIVDKHCVGGLPGNRTTLIVTPIVAAAGLIMPKTSSRAITSPAGTADTMEVFAPVDLSLNVMRRVVEKEGACIAWGGKLKLSPADDIMIIVERALDIDTEGQLVASIISKKIAAGSTKAVFDLPIGPTAKVRTEENAVRLGGVLKNVGNHFGLEVEVVHSDGTQPVGHGIGPALEARDVLAVLSNEITAPQDLKERALTLAGKILEFSPLVGKGNGYGRAKQILDDGTALKKFIQICEDQGGMHHIPKARYTRVIESREKGVVASIDNRKLARIAKLSGAPMAKVAGLDLHVKVGSKVEKGMPLFTLHAESPGELEYALHYYTSGNGVIEIKENEL